MRHTCLVEVVTNDIQQDLEPSIPHIRSSNQGILHRKKMMCEGIEGKEAAWEGIFLVSDFEWTCGEMMTSMMVCPPMQYSKHVIWRLLIEWVAIEDRVRIEVDDDCHLVVSIDIYHEANAMTEAQWKCMPSLPYACKMTALFIFSWGAYVISSFQENVEVCTLYFDLLTSRLMSQPSPK